MKILNYATGALLLVSGPAALAALLFSNFVPNHQTVEFAKFGSIFLGIFFFFFFWRPGWDSRMVEARLEALQQLPRILRTPTIRAPFMGAAFFCLSWVGLSAGLPWVYTVIFGSAGVEEVVVSGWESDSYSSRSGHSCERPLIADVPFMMLGRKALCLDASQKLKFPTGTRIELHGQKSPLGIDPTSISSVDS
ncbi:hypothetical protein [Solimonas flava]|uniref:hypothetical protein n=1 Tax=Solimonas flava TaxID=415849 RepID=UPI0012B65521|nr:hypothetical protein [Solimonas flava]